MLKIMRDHYHIHLASYTLDCYLLKFSHHALLSLHSSHSLIKQLLKISLVLSKCQCLCEKCLYNAGIMLDAFAILLCSKLCWHNWLNVQAFT